MNVTEKTVTSEEKFCGRLLRLQVDTVTLPNGTAATREVVRHPGGVCVAALTDQRELLFVRQFRYPYAAETLELPAGKREPGEDPFVGIKRELQEETGATADRWIPLGQLYPTPGYCDEVIFLYAATGLHFGAMHPDEDEFLEPERIPLDTAVQMVMDGTLPDAKTQVLVLKAAQLAKQGEL